MPAFNVRDSDPTWVRADGVEVALTRSSDPMEEGVLYAVARASAWHAWASFYIVGAYDNYQAQYATAGAFVAAHLPKLNAALLEAYPMADSTPPTLPASFAEAVFSFFRESVALDPTTGALVIR